MDVLRRCFVVPHTHWDREWYLPFEQFQLRLAAVVDEVLDGQAVVLEDYLEARPGHEGRLRALIAARRLEVGPSYMLPDEFLVGGESLVRNLLLGRIVCERFGAHPSPVGYLPDSFGHPLQLPQILAGFGIDSFIFSRGLGDELDEVGAVFRWRAPDGSEVRAIQQLPSYSNFGHVGDADDALRRVEAIRERFAEPLTRAGVRDLLLCAGDDHVRIRRDLPELCAELERRLSGTEFTIATYADYVEALDTSALPVFTGELLGSRLQNVLRGVNSARLYLKQANERAERGLLAAETVAALGTLHAGQDFPVSDFRLAWSRLLRCEPHDSICGCSCDEVHRDMLVRYELLDRTVAALGQRALAAFARAETAPDPKLGVVNMLPERRRGLVEAAGMEPVVVELEGFSARTIDLRRASERGQPGAGDAIESDRFRVEASSDGTLTVIDKQRGHRYEHLHGLEDELDQGDLYNFCPVEAAQPWRSDGAAVRVLRDAAPVWELELRVTVRRPAGLTADLQPESDLRPLNVTTVVRLVQGIERIEFRTTVENATRDHRLRAVFPIGVAELSPTPVRAEGQFALVRRPLTPSEPRTEWLEPPDPTQHTLGAVAVGPLALLTKGLPEYEARPSASGTELCLTLLRATGIISRPSGAMATRPHTAGPQLATPEGQCLGRHELEYALLPGADAMDAVALLRASQDYRCGFVLTSAGVHLDPPLSIEGDVVFSCLKGAEDGEGLILRCHNPLDHAASVHITGAVSVSRTRLDEADEQPLRGEASELGPGQIGTFRLRRDN